MSKLSAIVVDDERLARVNLKRLLDRYHEINVVSEADSCSSAVKAINDYHPDIVFLDIQLSYETGFDILEKIDTGKINVVFVTAYDEYAIRAFEVNAIDYLLKPVNPQRLEETVKRLTSKKSPGSGPVENFRYNDTIYIKLSYHTSKFISINSIVVISSVGNYTKLKVSDGKNYVVLKTLKQWEEELPGEHFVRIHRSTIVNIEFILRIEKYSARYFRLYAKNMDDPFEVSRRYLSGLKKKYRL